MVNGSRFVCYATGLIGTPIHELSHAVMCLVFFHKIEEMKLFQIDDEEGTLGYVKHSYNKRNIWQLIGNYFIGIAPIVVGTAFVYFLSQYFAPSTFGAISSGIDSLVALAGKKFSFDYVLSIFATMGNILATFFAELTTDASAWLFLLFALCIAIHMNLSGADIKGSLTSLPILILLLAVINAVGAFIIPSIYSSYIRATTVAGGYIVCLLCLSLTLSLLYILVTLIIKAIIFLVKLLFHR